MGLEAAQTAIGIAVVIVGAGTAWLFNLHGRMSRHESACEQRQKNLDERHEHIERQLGTIDQKLDRLMGHHQ